MGRPCRCCGKEEEKKHATLCRVAIHIDEASPYTSLASGSTLFDSDLQYLRALEFEGVRAIEPLGEVYAYFCKFRAYGSDDQVLPDGYSYPAEVGNVYEDVERDTTVTVGSPSVANSISEDFTEVVVEEWMRVIKLPCDHEDHLGIDDEFCCCFVSNYDVSGSMVHATSYLLRLTIKQKNENFFETYNPSFYVPCEDRVVDFETPISYNHSEIARGGERWVAWMSSSLFKFGQICPPPEE